ncbi:MAG: xanthine dehydrogenase accessory protein XdhC [Burkholderiaceae bacterium]
MRLTDLAGGTTASPDLFELARECLAAGVPAMLVSIVETRGSTPRETDALMLVSPSRTAGTIGGGHLEWRAIEQARRWLDGAAPRAAHDQRFALGPSLGQCCGGALTLRHEALDEHHLPRLQNHVPTVFRLHLFGAGHVGRAVVQALATVPCVVEWIDERESVFPVALPEHTRVVFSDDPAAEVDHARPGDYYLVMTHSHARDLEIVGAILRRNDAGYLGLIGSRTKRARFEHRLRARGLDPQGLHCPIGLPGATGKEPWRIALSVVADLVARAG